MKVIHICFSRAHGGLELSIPKIALLNQNSKYKTTIIAPKSSLICDKAIRLNLEFETSLLPLFKIPRNSPITLILHRSKDLKWVVLLKWILPKARILYVSHMMLGVYKRDPYHKWLYSLVDHVITFSKTQKNNHMEFLPLLESKISCLWHSLDLTSFDKPTSKQEAKRQIHYLKPDFLIGCVGRFDPQKGQLILANACLQLKQKGLKFHLMMIGSETKGEEGTLQKLKNYVTQNELQNEISFYESQPLIQNFFKAFDLFVMPSDQEAYGLVLVEAMLCGTLSMAFKKGGPIDILNHGKAGLLVEGTKDSVALAQALEAVIKTPDAFKDLADIGYYWAREISHPDRFQREFAKVISGLA